MSEEKRKIILKKGEPAQTNYFRGAVSAKPDKAIDVPDYQAIIAIHSGKFEYAEDIEPEISLDGPLPDDFPFKDELAKVGLVTLEQINAADDEAIKGAKNVSKAKLKDIRRAADDLTKKVSS